MILLIYLFICQKITGFVAENRIVNYHWFCRRLQPIHPKQMRVRQDLLSIQIQQTEIVEKAPLGEIV